MYRLKNIRKGIIALLIMGVMAACNPTDWAVSSIEDGVISGKLLDSRSGDDAGEAICFAGKVTAVVFDENEKVTLIREQIEVDQNGQFNLVIGSNAKTCYFIANLPKEVIPGLGSSEEEFKQLVMTGWLNPELEPVMWGKIELDSYHWEPILMERCVARMDVELKVSGIAVQRISLKGVADRSFLFPHQQNTPEEIQFTDRILDFTDEALTESKSQLAYLYEQQKTVEVVMDVTVDGRLMELRKKLPEGIKRNGLYTLKVYGNGVKLNLQIQENDWQLGPESETTKVMWAKVDAANSELDEARVSEKGDTVFIPYLNQTISLRVNTPEGITLRPVGNLDLAEVSVEGSVSRSEVALTQQTTVTVHSQLKRIEMPQQYFYLDAFDSEGVMKGRVVLVFENNPVKMTGILSFQDSDSVSFGQYIEGELARFILPEGMKAELVFEEGEDSWALMKETGDASGELRLLAGWRPNDPKADGRRQSVSLKFSRADGTALDTYQISRKNYGLPVVNVAGNWWCKYNLKGTANDFEDQILSSEDPLKDGSLLEFLKTCSDEDLFAVMGDQYQGGNLEGLPLAVVDGKFCYAGFNSNVSVNINTQSTRMAPVGYELPSVNDFRRLVASDNYELKYSRKVYHNNLQGEDSFNIVYQHGNREVRLNGTLYGKIGFYDFCEESYEHENGRHMALFGWGHQWDANPGQLSEDDILFANRSDNSVSWTMEGWFVDMRGNWFKAIGHNNKKSRTIRCKKSAVEYMY